MKKCPITCPCLCHDTDGGFTGWHDPSIGRGCPTKFLTPEEAARYFESLRDDMVLS